MHAAMKQRLFVPPQRDLDAGAHGEAASLTLHVTLKKGKSKATRPTVHSMTLDGNVHPAPTSCKPCYAE